MRLKSKRGDAPPPMSVEPSQIMDPEDAMRASARPAPRLAPRPQPQAQPSAQPQPLERLAGIGKSVQIKGELNGNEDITVEGTVEGKIVLSGHNLTIGTNGRITAEIAAKCVIVNGTVVGNIDAEDRIEVRQGGSVQGDLCAPRVVLAEGARFKGSVDMQADPVSAPPAETWEQTPQSAMTEDPDPENDAVFDDALQQGDFTEDSAEPEGSPDDEEPQKSKKASLENMFDSFDPSGA